jgi:hypothetical protein
MIVVASSSGERTTILKRSLEVVQPRGFDAAPFLFGAHRLVFFPFGAKVHDGAKALLSESLELAYGRLGADGEAVIELDAVVHGLVVGAGV